MPKKGVVQASSRPEKSLEAPPAAQTASPVDYTDDGEFVKARMLAVDPGDVHVGIAEFVETLDSWECVRAYELDWMAGVDTVAQHLEGGRLGYLVVENFRLYADQAMAQVGSEMLTAQCIGAIKYLHALYMRRYERLRAESVFAPVAAGVRKCELVLQPASIQKATDRICKAKGIPSEAKGNDHARSAELHGWHFVLKREGNNDAAWAAEGE